MNDTSKTIQESWLEGDFSYSRLNAHCIIDLRLYCEKNNLSESFLKEKSQEIYSMFRSWGIESGLLPKTWNPLTELAYPPIYELDNRLCFSSLFLWLVLDGYGPALEIIDHDYQKLPTAIAVIALREFAKLVIPQNALAEYMEFQASQIIYYQVAMEIKSESTIKAERFSQSQAEGREESARVRAENAATKIPKVIEAAIQIWRENPLWDKAQVIKRLQKERLNEGYEKSYLNNTVLVNVKAQALKKNP